jgi:hypothetical protein
MAARPAPRRIDAAPLVAAAGALVLLVSLFLDWFGVWSAWTVFEVWDLVLAALAIGALLVAARLVGAPLGWPRRTEGVLPLLGLPALLIVASQLLNAPPTGQGRDLDIGAWLGLAGALALAAGGVMSVARVAFEVRFRSPRAAAGEPPPEEAPTTRLGPEPGETAPPGPPPAGEAPAPGEAPERRPRRPGETA